MKIGTADAKFLVHGMEVDVWGDEPEPEPEPEPEEPDPPEPPGVSSGWSRGERIIGLGQGRGLSL